MKIKKLPAEVRSKLESGLVITDAVRCIIELVHNSLDAQATVITVKIDFKNYLIQVVDNGKGIGKDDLKLVGERFMTSKYPTLGRSDTISTYGFKGQAISSLLDVCRTFTIETKSAPNGPLYVKIFKNNTLLPITEKNSNQNGTGTTITVEDFMCNMPVRRRRISEVFDMEEIKTHLQYLGIIHHNVSFTLRNENKDTILLQKKPSSSVLLSISSIFGHKIAKSLKPVSYRDKKYKITGFVSSKTQPQHNIQLIYVNKRIVSKGVIHKFVNNMMKEYLGEQNFCGDSSMEGGIILQKLKNPTHSVFILLIKAPNSTYEFSSYLKKSTVEFKNWKEVMKCIHRAVRKVFKSDENSLDSSVVLKRKIKKKKGENVRKGKFGTSLLINAIRGVPVKRKGERDNKKQKKKKVDDSVISQLVVNEETVESVLPKSNAESSWSDLESPIPKTQFQSLPQLECNFESPNDNSNEFYEWLKIKYKTDENAYNLYQDFLQYKQGKETVEKPNIGLKSPILGKRFMAKKNAGKTKSRNQNKFLKISPLKAKTPKIKMDIVPNTHNITDIEKPKVFSEPAFSPILNSNPGATVFWDKSSPPSSEDVFKNLLKLRNSSNKYSHNRKKVSSTITHSWVSHYNRSTGSKAYDHLKEKENYHVQPNNLESNFFNDSNPRSYNQDESLNIAVRGTSIFQDAGIQTSISVEKSPVQRINALVQTTNADISLIPDSQSFENSFSRHPQISPNLQHDDSNKVSKNISQEVPNPDFWNIPTPDDIRKNSQSFFAFKAKSPPIEKCSSSSEIVCGQKTNSTKPISVESKETQTLAALWADCGEDNPLHSSNFSSLNIEVTQLPDTIPIEEIGSLAAAPPEIGFCLTERHDFMPKGLSPRFENSEDMKVSTLSSVEKSRIMLTIENPESELLANVKWINESTGALIKPTIPDGILDEMRKNFERNKIFYEHEILSASLSYCAIKVHNLLYSFTFTKEVLSGVEVLGQLDKKFIVAKMDVTVPKKMELMSLFDQHAVDERIKLEELMEEFLTLEGQLIPSNLNTPIECVLNESVVRVLSNLEARLIDFGLTVKIINEKTISILGVPLFLLEKHKKILKNKKSNYLSELLPDLVTKVAEELTETRGAASKIPKIVHNAFCSEACHKAIRFNKALEMEEMVDIIKKLKNCKLPFQCAHGRPSVIPIIDLEDFKDVKLEDEIDFEKVKKFTYRKSGQDDIIESSERVK